jgi:NAD(P)-dependent dehydrogenase (short-subunit alcohol dehydrogenase family)
VPIERQEAYLSSHLAPRLGTPQDVAGMFTFLLSDQAEWIIGVDGGMVLR